MAIFNQLCRDCQFVLNQHSVMLELFNFTKIGSKNMTENLVSHVHLVLVMFVDPLCQRSNPGVDTNRLFFMKMKILEIGNERIEQ